MTSPVDELSQQAHSLSREERVRLAEELLAAGYSVDDQVEAAWDEEIKPRISEIDDGTARLIPAEEVVAQARNFPK